MIPFEEQIGNEKVAVIAQTLETALWQGDTTSETATWALCDG